MCQWQTRPRRLGEGRLQVGKHVAGGAHRGLRPDRLTCAFEASPQCPGLQILNLQASVKTRRRSCQLIGRFEVGQHFTGYAQMLLTVRPRPNRQLRVSLN